VVTVRVIHRVLAAVIAVSAAVLGAAAWLASRADERALAAQVERSALILSDTIKSSTRQAMLLDEREMVDRIVATIGRQEGLGKIRIFDKDGGVVYSPDPALVGTAVDVRSEACDVCHLAGRPLSEVPHGSRTRRFVDEAGRPQLGVVNPILNEPACSNAACHAHDAGQRVLGVLDVTLSLAEVERAVAAGDRRNVALSAAAIAAISLLLWIAIHRLVDRPVARLLAATRAVAAGDLAHRLVVERSDELGQLAQSFNDMTAHLADARRQVYQSNKLASLGRLAAGIAHEINNPLTGVLTYSSFLLKRAEDPEVRGDLETIVHETRRCRDIVRGLLDFARQVPPKKSAVEVNEIVTRALDIVRNQLDVLNIRVTQSLAAELPQLHADPNQLQQVLVNLLVNAADACDEGGEHAIYLATDLKTRDDTKVVEIKVADDGKGIPERDLGKIFEPFFSTKEHKGTGLGLAVVWGIVHEHGGRVTVASRVGHGTTFTVLLPLPGAPPLADEGEP
jgi:two-component system, NtrC family, sensor kinase